MADIFHMNPDLVGASRIQNKRYQRTVQGMAVMQAAIMGTGILAGFQADTAFYGGTFCTGNGSADGAGTIGFAIRSRQIFPMNLAILDHMGKNGCAQLMPGYDEKAGGVPVQPVDSPIYKGLSLLLEIMSEAIGQGAVIVPLRGMHRSIGRFADHQNVFILIDDIQIHGNRDDVFGNFGLFQLDHQDFS